MTRSPTIQNRPSPLCILTALFIFTLLQVTLASQPQHDPAVTVPPPAEEIASLEAAADLSRKEQHDAHVRQGRQVAYIVTLAGKDFPSDKAQFSVQINGSPAPDIILINSTAFSFRIPSSMALDRDLLRTSFVEISIAGRKHINVPLVALEMVITRVDLVEYRNSVEKSQRLSEEETTAAGHGSQHSEQAALHDDHPTMKEDEGGRRVSVDRDTATFEEDEENIVHPHSSEPDSNTLHHSQEESETDLLVSRAERLLSEETHATTKEAIAILKDATTAGDARAMTIFGAALLSGTAPGLQRDFERAVNLLQLASDKGYPDAQAMLGFLHASGMAGTALRKDIGAALLMWAVAAEGGSMYAKMALAYRYFTGMDLSEDCEMAAKYYKDVADDVFHVARESLDRQTGRHRQNGESGDDTIADIRPPTPSAMLTSDRKRLAEGMTKRVLGEANEVVQYYRLSADRGDAAAQVMMGTVYYYGAVGMPQDLDRARRLFNTAARAGRAEAHAHLGFMDLRAGRNASAASHLGIAASQGDRLGLHGMGFLSLHGIGVAKDAQMAAEYFTKAMEKDHPEAMFNLAIMYSKGIGVPRSLQEAFRLFQTAARFGHMQSNYHVGIMMLRGDYPAKKDCALATQYLKLVSQQGVWNKIISKAFRAYEKGAYADALYRYLHAAHAGIELAQFNAGFMYEHNTLRNTDGFKLKQWVNRYGSSQHLHADRSAVVEEALELYQMSASQGHSDSMVRTGDLLFAETKDFPRAALAYGRAVKLNNAEAMFNLGWMHARGFGMSSDKHMAKRYFDQAMGTDSDAALPAMIAVYSLKCSESFFGCLKEVSKALDRLGWFGSESALENSIGGGSIDTGFGSVDAIAFSVLFVVLAAVLSVRQWRLVANRAREGGELGGRNQNGAEGNGDDHEHAD